jgi:hypothetical protein
LFYLLTGTIFFTYARHKRFWPLLLSVICWAIAMQTKPQTLPFIVSGLAFPLVLALWQRRLRMARLFVILLIGTLVVFWVFSQALKYFQINESLAPTSIVSIYDMVFETRTWFIYWFVLDPEVRLSTLIETSVFVLPLLLGLSYSARLFLRNLPDMQWDYSKEVGRLILWTFTACWLAWYLLLSIGWTRYLFPTMFSGSVFVALLLRKASEPDHSLRSLIRNGASVFHRRCLSMSGIGIILTAVFVPGTVGLTVMMLGSAYLSPKEDSIPLTISYVNNNLPKGSIIESVEYELFFLLEQPYHYPPVSVINDLNRRTFLSQNVIIDYDPLVAAPDYLVVGRMGRMWHLYDPFISTGAFRLLCIFGDYQIYERVDKAVVTKHLLVDPSSSVIHAFKRKTYVNNGTAKREDIYHATVYVAARVDSYRCCASL